MMRCRRTWNGTARRRLPPDLSLARAHAHAIVLLVSGFSLFFFSCAGLRLDAQALAANASSASGCGDLGLMMGAPRRGATTGLTVIWESANQTQHNPLFFFELGGEGAASEKTELMLMIEISSTRRKQDGEIFFFLRVSSSGRSSWFNSSGAGFRNRSGPLGSLISIDHHHAYRCG